MAMSVRIIPFWIFTAFSKGYHHKINIFLAFYPLKNVLFPVFFIFYMAVSLFAVILLASYR